MDPIPVRFATEVDGVVVLAMLHFLTNTVEVAGVAILVMEQDR